MAQPWMAQPWMVQPVWTALQMAEWSYVQIVHIEIIFLVMINWVWVWFVIGQVVQTVAVIAVAAIVVDIAAIAVDIAAVAENSSMVGAVVLYIAGVLVVDSIGIVEGFVVVDIIDIDFVAVGVDSKVEDKLEDADTWYRRVAVVAQGKNGKVDREDRQDKADKVGREHMALVKAEEKAEEMVFYIVVVDTVLAEWVMV